MGVVLPLADWASRVDTTDLQETELDHDDRSIDSDDVPDLESLDSNRHAQIGDMQHMSTRNGGGGDGGERTTSLLPYYIEPLVIGQRDATIVVVTRGMIPRALNEMTGDLFRHPTITSFRIREVHDTHIEVRIRMGLFFGPTDQRPMRDEIMHRDMMQVD